jgi:ribonuclease BN (tRNA processing enzyme)
VAIGGFRALQGEIAAAAGVRTLVLTHLPPTADPKRAIELARARYSGAITVATEGVTFEVGG